MSQQKQSVLLNEVLDFKPQKIMVIGDLMLDQYNWGTVDRISPEAPIPVVKMEKEEFRLGGAANVAANIKMLDCDAYPVGLVGNCQAGHQILDILHKTGISHEGVVVSEDFQTVIKQRILTHQQQLLRLDYESASLDFSIFENQLIDKIKALMPKVNGIVISDYGKGAISPSLTAKIVQETSTLNIPVICDPAKGRPFEAYKGVTVIKPNRLETEEGTLIKLTDRDAILRAASIVKEKSQAKFLTISLDKDGVLFYQDAEQYNFLATEAPEVHDTTGAGDVFVSALAVLLAKGVSSETASQIANIAGGLETSHLGVVSIPWSDIVAHLSSDSLSRKITTLPRLKQELTGNRKQPLIFTNGYFDKISAGHLRFLQEINRIKGMLVVAINSDQSIIQEKGSAPLLAEQDRARLLASIENVAKIIIFDDQDASQLIYELSPDIVVKGVAFKGKRLPEQKAIDASGATIEFIQHFSW